MRPRAQAGRAAGSAHLPPLGAGQGLQATSTGGHSLPEPLPDTIQSDYAARREAVVRSRQEEAAFASAAVFGRSVRLRTLATRGPDLVATRPLDDAPLEAAARRPARGAAGSSPTAGVTLPEAAGDAACLELMLFDEQRTRGETAQTAHWRLLQSRNGAAEPPFLIGTVAEHRGPSTAGRAGSAALTLSRVGAATEGGIVELEGSVRGRPRRPSDATATAPSAVGSDVDTDVDATDRRDPSRLLADHRRPVAVSSGRAAIVPTLGPAGLGVRGVTARSADWAHATDLHAPIEGGAGRVGVVVLRSDRPPGCRLAVAGSRDAAPGAGWAPAGSFFAWQLTRIWVLVPDAWQGASHEGGGAPRILSPRRALPGHFVVDTFAVLAGPCPGCEPFEVWYSAAEAAELVEYAKWDAERVRQWEAYHAWAAGAQSAEHGGVPGVECGAEYGGDGAEYGSTGGHTDDAGAAYGEEYGDRSATKGDEVAAGVEGEGGASADAAAAGWAKQELDETASADSGSGVSRWGWDTPGRADATCGSSSDVTDEYADDGWAGGAPTPRMLVSHPMAGTDRTGWRPAVRGFAFSAPLPGTHRMVVQRRRMRGRRAAGPGATVAARTAGAQCTMTRFPLGAEWRTVCTLFVLP